ncbi:hypothetical protein [Streptomyces cinereospinus]|uniref:Uncharacterized protein n=1 Tax=Streptomyces cinereospinus TaxID=285561 RepID=A0ABV5N5J9_9ACTN
MTDTGLVCATRTLLAPAQDVDALFPPYSVPRQSRGGLATRLEHGHRQVTLYARARDRPDGLAAVGDSAGARNPAYAQGVTAAVLRATS